MNLFHTYCYNNNVFAYFNLQLVKPAHTRNVHFILFHESDFL
jgi:hypothetical protein